MCVCVCVRCTQMHCMTLISLVLAVLAVMPCGNGVAYKVMTRLHSNAFTKIRVQARHIVHADYTVDLKTKAIFSKLGQLSHEF